MTHPIRSLLAAGSLVAAVALAGCGSGGSDASPSTTEATTTVAPDTTTTEPGTTTTSTSTSTATDQTTTTDVAEPDSAVDCQALLQEYAEVFDPDDLASTAAFFRSYEADMPADVAAATERLAVAYEDAGDLGSIDLGDVDLTADAQAFSDWTNDGCPAG